MAAKHTINLSEAVRDVLNRTNVAQDGAEFILTLPEQLDRKLYEDVDKILKALGGKWTRHKKGHVFIGHNPLEELLQAVENGTVVDEKKLNQFYETPPEVAELLIMKLGKLCDGMRILEPSAGKGAIAMPLLKKAVGMNASVYLLVCEINPKRAEYLEDNSLEIFEYDFLSVGSSAYDYFDRVIANPPFTGDADIRHVMLMYKCLKPGGKLVSVMSPRWTFCDTGLPKEFKSFLSFHKNVWTELPEGSFKVSGTNVRTGIIEIWKPAK